MQKSLLNIKILNMLESKHMTESHILMEHHAKSTWERDEMSVSTCSECGEVFTKPVLATVSSGGFSKTYYACPRCLTKVRDTTLPKSEEREKKLVTVQKTKNSEDEGRCVHFLGFLKKRPKNMPIPDECLTCNRMIECLTR
jgi:uncharacterized CHY-type Zn-finger protein